MILTFLGIVARQEECLHLPQEIFLVGDSPM
jgi:hypothetical protein